MSKGLEALKRLSAVASMYCDECATSEEDLDRGMFERDYQAVKTIEKQLKALNVISQNFRLVGNCLHAKNKYAEDGWVFVKEIEDEEESNAWKEVLL